MERLLAVLMIAGCWHPAKAADRFWGADPKDPWRIIEERTIPASGNGWVSFSGQILEVQPAGIRVDGWYSAPKSEGLYIGEFFVSNFPYVIAEKEVLPTLDGVLLVAKRAGVYSYVTTLGGNRTIRKLEYGNVWKAPPAKPPSAEQIAAAKAANAKKKDATAKAAFRFHQERAEHGEATSQYRLGMLYLDGTGCARDTNQARAWFKKAADQGNEDAGIELKRMAK